MLTSMVWLAGYVVTVTLVKILYKRNKLTTEQFNYLVTAGLFLWPLFLFFGAIEHGTDYLAEFFGGKDKVRVDIETEIKQLKVENVFLASELSEAQQKLSVLDGYRDRR